MSEILRVCTLDDTGFVRPKDGVWPHVHLPDPPALGPPAKEECGHGCLATMPVGLAGFGTLCCVGCPIHYHPLQYARTCSHKPPSPPERPRAVWVCDGGNHVYEGAEAAGCEAEFREYLDKAAVADEIRGLWHRLTSDPIVSDKSASAAIVASARRLGVEL